MTSDPFGFYFIKMRVFSMAFQTAKRERRMADARQYLAAWRALNKRRGD